MSKLRDLIYLKASVPILSGNLYNSSKKTDGYYINASGKVTEGPSASISDYMAVEPGDYVWTGVSGESGSNNKRAVGYNSSKTYTSVLNSVAVTGAGVPYTNEFTVPNGTAYVRISFNTTDTHIVVKSK